MADPISSLPTNNYFTALSHGYALQTGNTTSNLLTAVLPKIHALAPLSPSSIIHDNASGPGTATAALHQHFGADTLPKTKDGVLITDNAPAMVAGARDAFPQYDVRELDSQTLEGLPADHFTHSFTNYSIFTFPDPAMAMAAVHRTLAPGGLAVVSCWERFTVINIVHDIQRAVRPDLPLMPVPGPQFYEEGVLKKVLIEGGFEEGKLEVVPVEVVVREGKDLDGLKGFLKGPFMDRAKTGWTEEELAKWEAGVDEGIKKEIEKFGGIKFQGWTALARK